jgi:hypothetical protein
MHIHHWEVNWSEIKIDHMGTIGDLEALGTIHLAEY